MTTQPATQPATPQRLRVLYIAGPGRSGSTLLASALGELPGFFYGGELYHAWNPRLPEQEMFSCGSRVCDCAIWAAVFGAAFGGFEYVDFAAIRRYRDRNMRLRYAAGMLLPANYG